MTAGPTCPSCKVPVLPGYTKCPKCHNPLPYAAARRAGTVVDPGGTVAEQKQSPIIPIVVAVAVAGSIIAFFALRGGGGSDKPLPVDLQQNVRTAPAPSAPQPTERPAVEATTNAAQPPARGPSPSAAGADLATQLRKLRLWSTVDARGDRVDVRTTTCNDPAMGPALEAARPSLQAAGLTKLRCLEESGRVVFERAL